MTGSRPHRPPNAPAIALLVATSGIVGCWRPATVDIPAPHVHSVEQVAEDAAEDQPPEEEPALNPDPDGLDPYLAETVNAPITLVDDSGKPVTIINAKGVRLEVRQEDGLVRRKVFCASCAPAVEGWVRTEDIVTTRVE